MTSSLPVRQVLLFFALTFICSLSPVVALPNISANCTVCNLVYSLLSSEAAQASFEGNMVPLEINPNNCFLHNKYLNAPQCLLPYIPTYDFGGPEPELSNYDPSETDNRAQGSINSTCKQIRHPQPMSKSEQEFACIFGCVRAFYSIQLDTRGSSPIYVVVIRKRVSPKCRRWYEPKEWQSGEMLCVSEEKNVPPPGIRAAKVTNRVPSVNSGIKMEHTGVNFQLTGQKRTSETRNYSLISSHSSPEAKLCRDIFNALHFRYQMAIGDYGPLIRLKSRPSVKYSLLPRYEKVTRLSEPANWITPSAQCITVPTDPVGADGYALFVVLPTSQRFQCSLGCTSLMYRYVPSGKLAEFFLSERCMPQMFEPCELLSKRFRILEKDTNTAIRSPFPVIMEVSDPRGDRKSAIRKEVKRIRGGFSKFSSNRILEIRAYERKGKKYQVIIWFYEKFGEY